jgi:hypothetical protein
MQSRQSAFGVSLPVQFVGNLSGGVALRLQFSNACQDALLCLIRFEVRSVRRSVVAKREGTNALTVCPCVVHGVSRSHWLTDTMMLSTNRPAALRMR